ncbi:MAG: phosphate ABC transporter permease PstA [Firmicutes bacterium]|nr:phosphate ABC transporter permease PstA [Bacillota bacterium]
MTKRKIDKLLEIALWSFSLAAIGFLLWLLIYIFIKGFPHITWGFLTLPNNTRHDGIFPMIINTLFIIIVSLAVSVPIGIGAAIYMVEYSKPGKIINTIRFTVETLAGIPSILYGLFGFIFFVTILKFGFSILAGALTLSIMVLPTIIRTTEESLKAVPNSYREGSLALGATKLTTVTKVVLPCAIPGILTAVILSTGRIVGETAAVYLTAGMGKNIARNIMNSGRTLSVHLYILAKEGISFEKTYATAAVLVILVTFINMAASLLTNRINKGVRK